MSQTISTASLEFARVPVFININGEAYNPTNDTVTMAFTLTTAAPTVFYTGQWETAGSTYFAMCLVGPGGTVTLTPGSYHVWWKVGDNPEIPVKRAPGQLIIQ